MLCLMAQPLNWPPLAAKVAPFPAANDTAAIINATAKALAAAIK